MARKTIAERRREEFERALAEARARPSEFAPKPRQKLTDREWISVHRREVERGLAAVWGVTPAEARKRIAPRSGLHYAPAQKCRPTPAPPDYRAIAGDIDLGIGKGGAR